MIKFNTNYVFGSLLTDQYAASLITPAGKKLTPGHSPLMTLTAIYFKQIFKN